MRLDRIKPVSEIIIGNAIQNTSADIWTDIVQINKEIWWGRDCLFFIKPAIYGNLLKEFLDKYGSYRKCYKDRFGCNFLCIPEYNFGNLLYILSRRGISIKRFNLDISEIKQDCDNTNCGNCTHYDLLDIKSIHNFH